MAEETANMRSFFEGKKILISGGTGSIGSELVKRLLILGPKVMRIFDNDENRLFEMEQVLGVHPNLRFLMGDLRDRNRLRIAVRDCDVVFHAAALKHVPICEYNPFEAIKTNVLGTQNLIEVSILENVEKFMLISTDKAVNPVSTMGATKLLCERLTIDAHSYKGRQRTVLSCVRFGNVMGTRGSVFEVFINQIENGGPVTVTDADMTRFVMLPHEATDLILDATSIARGGEIFVLKMPALRIMDLAEIMVKELTAKHGYDKDVVKIRVVGKRPGEKLHEELMSPYEAENAVDVDKVYVIVPQHDELRRVQSYYAQFRHAGIPQLASQSTRMLTENEIEAMVRELLAYRQGHLPRRQGKRKAPLTRPFRVQNGET